MAGFFFFRQNYHYYHVRLHPSTITHYYQVSCAARNPVGLATNDGWATTDGRRRMGRANYNTYTNLTKPLEPA